MTDEFVANAGVIGRRLAAGLRGKWPVVVVGGAIAAAALVGCGSSGPSQSEVEACAKRSVAGRLSFSAGFGTRCGDLFAIDSYSITDKRINGDQAIVDVLVKIKTTGRGFSGDPRLIADSCFGENGKLEAKVTVPLRKWESGWRCDF
jgi:hypothetical protein